VPLRVSSVNKEFDVVIIGDCNPDIVLSLENSSGLEKLKGAVEYWR